MDKLILASSSETRKILLSRVNLPFEVIVPNIDESRRASETPKQLAERLAYEKAMVILQKLKDKDELKQSYKNVTIIASDELLTNITRADDKILGKPHVHKKAFEQLTNCRNCLVRFYTSLCVLKYNFEQQELKDWQHVALTDIQFRNYTDCEIDQVIAIDKPFNCAGSIRSEGLSIILCQTIKEDETGALMGLPLLTLCDFLREAKMLE